MMSSSELRKVSNEDKMRYMDQVTTPVVTGVPVSGMDGKPTLTYVRGVKISMPTKFANDKKAKFTDVCWTVFFLLCCIAWAFLGWQSPLVQNPPTSSNITPSPSTTPVYYFFGAPLGPGHDFPVRNFCLAFGTACLFGLLGMFGLVKFLQKCGHCAVWGSLLLLPTISAVGALGMLADASKHGDEHDRMAAGMVCGVTCLFSLIYMLCVCCCWRDCIATTVALLDAVALVMHQYCCMFSVSLCAAGTGALWMLFFIFGLSGIFGLLPKDDKRHEVNPGAVLAGIFGSLVMLFWGLTICRNVAHVSYAKVVKFSVEKK